MSMPCNYQGCFECFMRDRLGEQEWVACRWDAAGNVLAITSQPSDPFELRSMRL